jgi:hypothetical protein
MAEEDGSAGGEHPTSFLAACKAAVAAISCALHTRLELFVTEQAVHHNRSTGIAHK